MTTARSLALSLLARRELQPMWRGLHRLALGGLGCMNGDPRRNGELRLLRGLATDWRRRGLAAPTVVDVGANEGDFTAAVRGVAPGAHIHAVEPNPPTFARLRDRFAGDTEVTPLSFALAATRGEARLYDRDPAGSPHASLYANTFAHVHPASAAAVWVPTRTLDDLAQAHGLARIHLLKLDTEGGERAILAGARRLLAEGRVEAVLLEFNAHNLLSGLTLLELSRTLGAFEIHRVLPNGLAPLVTARRRYNPREEIYKYANLFARRRADGRG